MLIKNILNTLSIMHKEVFLQYLELKKVSLINFILPGTKMSNMAKKNGNPYLAFRFQAHVYIGYTYIKRK